MSYELPADKKFEDFEDLTPDLDESLEIFDRAKNHSKFWRVRTYGDYVVRHWGRNGTKGQTKVEKFWSGYQAQEHARKLIASKKKKGYVAEAGLLEKFVREVD